MAAHKSGSKERLYDPYDRSNQYYPPNYNRQERFVKGTNYLNASKASYTSASQSYNHSTSRDYSLQDIDYLPYDPRYPPYPGYNPKRFRSANDDQPDIDASTLPDPDDSRPPHYMALSLVAFFLFGFILGGVAFGFSFFSRKNSKEGDRETGRRYGRYAFWLAMSGIATGCLMWVIVFWAAYTSSFPARYYWAN